MGSSEGTVMVGIRRNYPRAGRLLPTSVLLGDRRSVDRTRRQLDSEPGRFDGPPSGTVIRVRSGPPRRACKAPGEGVGRLPSPGGASAR